MDSGGLKQLENGTLFLGNFQVACKYGIFDDNPLGALRQAYENSRNLTWERLI
jgi:hypothetical protein